MSVQIEMTGELKFSTELTLVQASQILSFIGTVRTSTPTPNTSNSTEPLVLRNSSFGLNKSPREALIASNASKNSEKITAFGYYLMETQQLNEFTISEIRALFSKAGESIPQNFARDLKTAIQLNYIYESPNKKDNYLLTEKGIEMARSGFKGEIVKRSSSKPRSSKVLPKKDLREEIKNLEFKTSIDGYPLYTEMKTGGDRILWILQFCKINNIENLTPSDVEFISAKLGQEVRSRDFGGFNQRNKSKSFISNRNGFYNIQNNGIEFLRTINSSNNTEK